MVTVNKTISLDFSGGLRESDFFLECKEDATIGAKFLHTSTEGDILTIHFSSALDGAESTALNNLVSNHSIPASGSEPESLMRSVPAFAGCEISRNSCNYSGNAYDDTDYFETASVSANTWTTISYDSCSVIGNYIKVDGSKFVIRERGLYWYSIYTSCQVEGKKEAVIECSLKINGVDPVDGDSKTLCSTDIKTDRHLVNMSGSTALVCEEGDEIEVVYRYLIPSGNNKIRIPVLRFSVIKM